MTIRVLLVDDHTMFREALRALLAHAPNMEVVGEASDGAEVEALVSELLPDVVVMDVSMPGLNGIEATRRLHALHPGLRVVALSAFVYKRFVLEMLNAGAIAYVAKSAAGDELVRAIGQAMQGKTYLCSEAATALAYSVNRQSAGGGRAQDSPLGPREKEVLSLLAEGHSTAKIAATLHIAPSTAETHRRNIMRKLDLHNLAALTKYAIREGLITV